MQKIKFVVVESPFAPTGNTPEERAVSLARNIGYVRAAMNHCFSRGEVPYASHALYTLPGVLDDTKPEQRKQGIEAGFSVANALFFMAKMLPFFFTFTRAFYIDRGRSKGMVQGEMEAVEQGQNCEYRIIEDSDRSWQPQHDPEWTTNHLGELVRRKP